ncbi:MAG: hypothetical protein HC838_11915 [Spirulinaceae cyanobacterium RM2_2_10]|nr:hypothetical protein [Spirulinaceae cyanobacterium RM2_2_10]
MTAILGYRDFDVERDRIWGGYIAYDNRATDNSLFHQLGLGFESLGNIDFRINGYLPLGQSRNQYQTTSFDNGTQVTSLYFRNKFLLYDTLRTFGESRFYEVALGGFDAELGGKIATFGDDNRDLRAYGGIYHYTGQGIAPTWGLRARLEARPTDDLTWVCQCSMMVFLEQICYSPSATASPIIARVAIVKRTKPISLVSSMQYSASRQLPSLMMSRQTLIRLFKLKLWRGILRPVSPGFSNTSHSVLLAATAILKTPSARCKRH